MNTQHGARRGATNVELDPDNWSPAKVLRLTRLARELRLTDQILTSDMDTVSIVESGPAPAWTTLTGDHITFAADKMPFPQNGVDVSVWLGTNAHEVGHVLFTPRQESTLIVRLTDAARAYMPGLMKLHNIVEDQREERLMLAMFSPWSAYLIAALSHHLVVDNESAHLLLVGRTWLPAKMRANARASFVKARSEAIAAKVAVLIGNYQRLTDPGETQAAEAFSILEDLWNIFDDKLPNMPTGCSTTISEGEPNTEPADPASVPPAADEPPQGEPADDDDDAEGEGDAPVPPQGDTPQGDTPPQGDAPQGDTPADAEGDQPQSDGNGKGKGKTPPSDNIDPQQVKDDLRKAAEDALKDDDARRDLDNVLDALKQPPKRGEHDEEDVPQGSFNEPSEAARRLHHEVADALLDLKDQTEPGWQRRVESGRLNTRRLFAAALDESSLPDYETMFDRFQPGEMDAADFEFVLVLDVSSSMNRYRTALAEAMWAIHQSVDDLEARVTIITYNDDDPRIVAVPHKRPDGRMFSPQTSGGTEPVKALAHAYKVLADSSARHRIMLVLTDGAWSNAYTADSVIAEMNAAGILTAFAFLGHDHLYNGDAHRCQVKERIDQPAGLALLFRRIAAERIRASL